MVKQAVACHREAQLLSNDGAPRPSLLAMRISLPLAHRARSMIRPGHRFRATRRTWWMPSKLQAAPRDIVALPAALSVQLIRARPTTRTDRSMPKYPSPTPIMVTTHGTRTYSFSVAVLATNGVQYHPRYSILSLSVDGTWRYEPYGTSATLLSADAALSTLNPDPQHSFATMLVYRLCVPPATAAAPRPTARASTSKRRANHRSTDRSRAQRRVTTVAVTNAHVPAPRSPTPTPTSTPQNPHVPGAFRSSTFHARVRSFTRWHRCAREPPRPALPSL